MKCRLKRGITLTAAIPLALILGVSCERKAEDASIASPEVSVQVLRVELKDFSADIASFGSIVYTKKNDITSAVDGIVETVNFKEGDTVRAGQSLERLSNVQLMIRRDQANAALRSAEAATKLSESEYADYRRQIEARFIGIEKTGIEMGKSEKLLEMANSDLRDKGRLLDIGGITEETMKSARFSLENSVADYEMLKKEAAIARIGLRDRDLIDAGFEVPSDPEKKRELLTDLNTRTKKAELDVARAQETAARTELSSAQALIDELAVVSPIGGIVGAIYKESGERVASGDKLMTIFSSDDAWVVFPVNEGDLYRLKKGMKATILVESVQDEPINGVIDLISPTVDPQSGNVTVKALVRNMGNRGKPGMFASVTVSTGIPLQKILIPLTSLAQKEDKAGVVLTVRNGRVFKRKVALGIEHRGEIEVTDGLVDGESIVLEPTPLLREGDEVSAYEK